MMIMSKDIVNVKATKCMLAMFDMKDLQVTDAILGINILKNSNSLALSHTHYIQKILENVNYLNFKRVKTLIDMNLYLAKNKGKRQSQLDYARVVGSLIYVMNCARPYIACVISKLSRYTSNPNQNNRLAMKRVLGYLDETQNYALHYNKCPAVLEGCSDANWITKSTEIKSKSGYIFSIGRGEVSWKSSKQHMYCSFSLLVEEKYLGNHPNNTCVAH